MPNYPLRNVVAHGYQVIHQKAGYVSPTKNQTNNTLTEVLASLGRNDTLNITYWQMADDTIEFFRELPKHSDYKSIMARDDGPEFASCITVAQLNETTTLTVGNAVLMPHLYSRLKPQLSKAPKLDPNKTVAKIFTPGEFLGTINKPERFFVKLVFVGKADPTKGTLFKVLDRVGNIAYFSDRETKFKGKVHLGDCFAIHATPSRHTPDKSGEKHTIFRGVELIPDSIVEGKTPADPSYDESEGKVFMKGPF